ncbi:glycosyl transferase GT2 family [Apostichopus japonicus]|uniref:Glycosyl transferase GT2 family n=1 Tax=Stichopus japonicus TaxID=307972 RepID=A0A2G8KUR7_STIJA|nr:glycosyl transferase GT2 family [Apostichopus japonicus]
MGTCECDIFTVDNLLMCSKSIIEKNDCKKLLDYFKVPAKESKDIIKSDAPLLSVIHHLTEAGMASVDDISHLMTACSEKGLSQLAAVLTVYQKAQVIQKVLKDQQKALENKRQELSHILTESEDEKQQLTVRLKTTEEERQQLIGILKTTEEERQQFKDALKATEEEGQHLIGRLKATEEESQQFKDALKAKEEERQQLNGRLKTTEEERQQRNDILKATEEEIQLLNERLKTTEEERQQFRDRLNTTEYKLKTLNDEKDELLQKQKEELEGAKSSLRATKDELLKSQLEYAKESMALQEVLKQTREALNQKQLGYYGLVRYYERSFRPMQSFIPHLASYIEGPLETSPERVADLDPGLDSTLNPESDGPVAANAGLFLSLGSLVFGAMMNCSDVEMCSYRWRKTE